MQTPFWLPMWQAAESMLNVATESALVLPVMVLLCLGLGRRSQRGAMARAGRLFLTIGLVTGLLGALQVAAHGWINLVALPDALPSLDPLPFQPWEPAWLATTCAFLSQLGGVALLLLCRRAALPVWGTASAGMDEATARGMERRAMVACFIALLAFACLAGSYMVRSWPFLGLPEQMTQETVLQVLARHTWSTVCAALMPAGALAVLTFFLSLPPMTARQKREDREERRGEVIPGTAADLVPFSEEEKTTLRMGAAFALAGAAFQILDAGFTAFSPLASMGGGLRMTLMRFGPFLVTALSIVCWGFIFARPRRHQLFLALLPVLLIFLRAAGRF